MLLGDGNHWIDTHYTGEIYQKRKTAFSSVKRTGDGSAKSPSPVHQEEIGGTQTATQPLAYPSGRLVRCRGFRCLFFLLHNLDLDAHFNLVADQDAARL